MIDQALISAGYTGGTDAEILALVDSKGAQQRGGLLADNTVTNVWSASQRVGDIQILKEGGRETMVLPEMTATEARRVYLADDIVIVGSSRDVTSLFAVSHHGSSESLIASKPSTASCSWCTT